MAITNHKNKGSKTKKFLSFAEGGYVPEEPKYYASQEDFDADPPKAQPTPKSASTASEPYASTEFTRNMIRQYQERTGRKSERAASMSSGDDEGNSPATRGAAFRAARAKGAASFTWQGKKYHTRQAGESESAWRKKYKD